MIGLLFSRIMAAVATAALLACIIGAFSATDAERKNVALLEEAERLRQAFTGICGSEAGQITLDGEELLQEGHLVAQVGNSLLLHAAGRSLPVAEVPRLQNSISGMWSSHTSLLLCWNQTGVFIYLLKESANFNTAAASLRQSSIEL
jgi:hypothetical protein